MTRCGFGNNITILVYIVRLSLTIVMMCHMGVKHVSLLKYCRQHYLKCKAIWIKDTQQSTFKFDIFTLKMGHCDTLLISVSDVYNTLMTGA